MHVPLEGRHLPLNSFLSPAAMSSVVRVLRRHASTSASKKPDPSKLTDDKMRALISLYHQSETFITPENLSDRIDQVFAKDHSLAIPTGKRTMPTTSVYRETRARQVENPRLSDWELEATTQTSGTSLRPWSAMLARREQRVAEAMYGVDKSSVVRNSRGNDSTVKQVVRTMPGLEVLKESKTDAQKDEGLQERPSDHKQSS